MKVGISSTGNSLESMLDARFGRCGCFAIVDTDTMKSDFVQNGAKNESGGAGTAAAQTMIDNDVQAIITGNMGPNAFEVMSSEGIKVYRSEVVSIEKAVSLYKEDKLQQITLAGPAHAGMPR